MLNHIISTYPGKYIDTYWPIKNNASAYLYSDSIHLNDAGNKLVYDIIMASGLINISGGDYNYTSNILGTGEATDNVQIRTNTDEYLKFYHLAGGGAEIDATDRLGTTWKRLDFKANEYYLKNTSGSTTLSLSNSGIFSVPTDGDHTFGVLHLKTNSAADFELPTGSWIASTTTNTVIVPAINGTAGSKATLGYFSSRGWTSAAEVANTASSTGNLLLMKSGGSVGIGNTGLLHYCTFQVVFQQGMWQRQRIIPQQSMIIQSIVHLARFKLHFLLRQDVQEGCM